MSLNDPASNSPTRSTADRLFASIGIHFEGDKDAAAALSFTRHGRDHGHGLFFHRGARAADFAHNDSIFQAALLHEIEEFLFELRAGESISDEDRIARRAGTAAAIAGAVRHAFDGRARGQKRFQNAVLDEYGFARGNTLFIDFVASEKRLAIEFGNGWIIHEA